MSDTNTTTPIEPVNIASNTTLHPLTKGFEVVWTTELDNVSSKLLKDTWNQSFNTFDKCIELNKTNKDINLVLPIITGSGKTQSAIYQCRNLPTDTFALFVTVRTADADIIASQIGSTACSYHFNEYSDAIEFNKASNKEDTLNYNTLVITHEQYKLALADKSKREIFFRTNKGKRDLIIIDEYIALANVYKIDLVVLDVVFNFFSTLSKGLIYITDSKLTKDIDTLKQVISILESVRDTKSSLIEPLRNKPISPNYYESREGISSVDALFMYLREQSKIQFKEMIRILEDKNIDINKVLVSEEGSEKKNQELRSKYIQALEQIHHVYENWVYTYKSGKEVSFITARELIPGKSIVILDATASVNSLYSLNSKLKPNSVVVGKHIASRNFSNLRVNLLVHNTGKTDIEGINKDSYAESLAKEIIRVTTGTDRVMTITTKGFKASLVKYISPSVKTAHWGNITGSNAYRDTNIQFIFGLNHKPKSMSQTNMLLARSNIFDPFSVDVFGSDDISNANIISTLSDTDLIAEIIQAIMRTQARKVIDSDGNCDETNVYITVSAELKLKLINALKRYLPKIEIQDWSPIHITTPTFKPRIGDSILVELGNKLINVGDEISFKSISLSLKLKPKQLTDAVKTDKFKSKLYDIGCLIYRPVGQKDLRGRPIKGDRYFKKSC